MRAFFSILAVTRDEVTGCGWFVFGLALFLVALAAGVIR
jgi:hypothetical protein